MGPQCNRRTGPSGSRLWTERHDVWAAEVRSLMALSANAKGAVLMAGSMAGFVLNDAALKYGGTQIGVFQAILVRGVFIVIMLGCMAYGAGALRRLPAARDLRLISWRTLAEIGATLTFLTALFNLPLANVTAILQLTPLAISLAAVAFLGERLSLPRAVAILLGLAGVLLVLRPGAADFNAYAIFALAAVGFAVLRDLTVRGLSDAVSSLFVAWMAAIGITVAGAFGVVLTQSWVQLSVQDFGLLAISAVFLVIGYYCAVAAMRSGDVSFVSPFRYTVLIWAIGLGWFVFGDWPDGATFAGMAVLFVAGLYSLWAERSAARYKATSDWG